MHIGIEIVDWRTLGIGLLASARSVWIWLLDIGIEIVDWHILGVGIAAFMQLLLLVWLLIRGACTSPVAVCIFCIFCIFLVFIFSCTKKNNKHNNVVVTTFKLVEPGQAFFRGDEADDSRRRKPPRADWADWTNTGLPDAVELDDEDYNADNPERWLWRAKRLGFAYENQKTLRRTFF